MREKVSRPRNPGWEKLNRSSKPEFYAETSDQALLRIGSGIKLPRTKSASRMRKEKIT